MPPSEATELMRSWLFVDEAAVYLDQFDSTRPPHMLSQVEQSGGWSEEAAAVGVHSQRGARAAEWGGPSEGSSTF